MPRSYLRPAPVSSGGAHGHHRVTNIELLFDLVFVFAVTQLSHLLIGNFTLEGGAQALLLMLAVWWVWIFTSWVTNWLDPEKLAIRVLMLVMMTAGLLLSASLPQAFGSRGLAFALAYVFMQFGRTVFFLWAVRGESVSMRRNFQRIGAWLGISAVLWLTGGLMDDSVRWVCWIIALAIEWLGPSMGFYTPGLGRSTTNDWKVEGGHMAERCSLFILIALGESVTVTGSTFAGLDWSAANIAAMATSFIGSLAMWWLYFDTIAERGAHPYRTRQTLGASRGWPIPTFTSCWWRASSSGRWPMSLCWRTPWAMHTRVRPWRCWAARGSTCSATCCSSGRFSGGCGRRMWWG